MRKPQRKKSDSQRKTIALPLETYAKVSRIAAKNRWNMAVTIDIIVDKFLSESTDPEEDGETG